MKYAIITFGCKVNQYESNVSENAMNAAGFELCDDCEKPDIVIVNSCAVTQRGTDKARHAIRSAASDGAVTVLTGCYPQAYPDEAAGCGSDIIAGTAHRVEIPELIKRFLAGKPAIPDLTLPAGYEETAIRTTADKTRAFIKIEDGCDRYCSYCAIPYARGKVRSRTPGSIADEARLCAQAGHKELVLVGINLSRYGSDIGCGLADAVRAASEPEGIVRVRLSSLEPELLDEANVAALAECDKLCPHFHLSLQSGCDETLKRMNRHYDTAEYLNIMRRMKAYFPGCAITTDIIVGFPGETCQEFARSLDFARSAGFARIHVFTYSVRPGTAAAKFGDRVSKSDAEQRHAAMSEVAVQVYDDFLRSHIGKTDSIIVQKRTSPLFAEGLTADYAPVRVFGSGAARYDLIGIRITGVENGCCIGEEIPPKAENSGKMQQ